MRMIRTGDYKLILYSRAGVRKLFSLEADPLEINDLSGSPDQQERLESMFTGLINMQDAMGDTLDLRRHRFRE